MKASSRTLVFTFFEFLNKGIPFLMLPVLTRYMLPEEFGQVAVFLVFVSFFAIFIGLSGHGAVSSNFFRLSKKRLANYVSNVLFILFVSFLFLLILVFIFNQIIETYFSLPLAWQVATLFVALTQFITLINLTLWVIEKNPISYGIYQIGQTALFAVISLTLVVLYNMNWVGHLSGLIIAALSFGFVSLLLLYKRGYFTLNLRRLYIKDFLMFAIPMVPHQLGDWLRTQGDKLIIVTFIGVASTGIYSLGHQMALVMLILITSLNKALYPTLFGYLSTTLSYEDKKAIVKKSYKLGLFLTVIGLSGIILTPYLFPYLFGEHFQSAAYITQLIIVAMVFESYYYLVVNYVFYVKKTRVLAKITFSIALLHLITSLVLVGLLNFGMDFIALSMIAASFLQFLLVWLYSNKVYPMPWNPFSWNKYVK